MNKQYKNHSEVNKKYKWDLSFLLEGKTTQESLNQLIKLYNKIIKNKDAKYFSSEAYLEYLKYKDEVTIYMNKFANYVSNSCNLDVTNETSIALAEKFQLEFYKILNAIGSEESRFFSHSKELTEWIELPEYKNYKYEIQKNLEYKKYALPKDIQEYKIKTSKGNPDYTDIFKLITDSEVDYGYAKNLKCKKIKITRANRNKLMEHNDKNVRKSTAINFRNAYLKNKGSLSSLLLQHKKTESAFLLARGFNSAVEGLTFSDKINEEFLEILYKSVQKNIAIFKPYKKAYKRFYKSKFRETISEHDWSRPLIKYKEKITVQHAIEEVKNALKPFGKEYIKIVINALDRDNWVDFMSINNKISGAYSIGESYGVEKKLILMNFTGDLRSIETLSHEMGHSMHSYFSDKVQKTPYNSDYPIFLAEIASIFNELMLHDYWLKTSTNKKRKFQILQQQIDGFIETVIKQTQWSNYEFEIYKKIDMGEPIGSYDDLSKIYYEVYKKYSIEKPKKYDYKKQFPAIYVPHFYYGFYVYKYAVGRLVANIFFAKYKKEGSKILKFYIDKFLSAGGSMDPLDVLKNAGIDLKDSGSYDIGYEQARENIKMWIKLGKEIFKT